MCRSIRAGCSGPTDYGQKIPGIHFVDLELLDHSQAACCCQLKGLYGCTQGFCCQFNSIIAAAVNALTAVSQCCSCYPVAVLEAMKQAQVLKLLSCELLLLIADLLWML